ncbi:murein transglycosylase A [Bosea sp. 117]|uniref:murein transglycosylase A n=1 Tax=Bosea sp. 117 TaxID=1125973 RepID=UPI000690B74A|nr:murein transglycosylase A [Bosea sp. 117]
MRATTLTILTVLTAGLIVLTGPAFPLAGALSGAARAEAATHRAEAEKRAKRSAHRREARQHARKHPAPVFRMPQAFIEPISFDRMTGWAEDDHAVAFATFRKSCRPILQGGDPVRPGRPVFGALREVCQRAERLGSHPSETAAKHFFEKEFRPILIAPAESTHGFLTGYYEPEVEGSLTRTDEYASPLYRRPPDLVITAPKKGAPPSNKGEAFRRDGRELVPYYDRAEIEDGALADRKLEIAWLKDPADAFFAHIQGSVRVRLPDGGVLRLNYDGHNGQNYTPVGRILVERNIIPREKISMDAIRAYIAENPEAGKELMRQNKSYVFFRVAHELKADDGAVGAQGLPLTAGRSIAVDRQLHVYGTPFFIDAELPLESADKLSTFRRLMIAQDTGSAIIGPARADIFFGAGKEAGSIAGRLQHPGRFVMLLPRRLDPSLAPAPPLPRPRPADAPKGDATAETSP